MMETLIQNDKTKPQLKANKDLSLIYLVDDDPVYLTLLTSDMNTMPKIKTKAFSTGEECLKQMHLNPTLVVLDYDLAGDDPNLMNGVEVLKEIKKTNPETEVVMLSGWEDVTIAVASMKFGAYDYVVKNESALINIRNRAKNIFKKLRILQRLYDEKILCYFRMTPIPLFYLSIGVGTLRSKYSRKFLGTI